jgi:hypothetical protein
MAAQPKAPELNPDVGAMSASAASQREKDRAAHLDDEESEDVTKIKKTHIHRTKNASNDSDYSSGSSSFTSTNTNSLLNDPVTYVKSVQRGTWVRLVLLILTLAVLFFAWHPTAYYRTQLYFGQCVEIPTRSGMVHKICPPATIPHPYPLG